VKGATHSWLLKDPETMPGIVFELMKGELGTAVLRARLKAGIDSDDRGDVDRSPAFYTEDSLAVAITPKQSWHDDATVHRQPRYAWRTTRD
jgi:hypothetical protein